MRKCAVLTGGAGFLGSHLAERLLDEDIDVICLDNFLTGTADNLAHLQDRAGFRLLRVDVTDHISIHGPVDFVLHFASPASPIDYAELPIETLKAGSVGTLHTLGLAKDKGARYLLASTSETYGDPLVHPQPETYWGNVNPVGPRACYDEAKRFAEATTMSYRNHHGVNTAIMRIFNTYGPRMQPDDGRAIPTFVRQALAGEPITVAGDGSQTRSVCYVDDLIEGALRLLFSKLAGPVNIGNPNEFTVLDLARCVLEVTERAIPDIERGGERALAFRELGVKLALDDAGAGNAGLWMLSILPVDYIKIDGSIVNRALADKTCRAVLAGIAAIAQETESVLIAEGIETPEALQFVQALGKVHAVQGFLIAKPAMASTADFNPAALRNRLSSSKLTA